MSDHIKFHTFSVAVSYRNDYLGNFPLTFLTLVMISDLFPLYTIIPVLKVQCFSLDLLKFFFGFVLYILQFQFFKVQCFSLDLLKFFLGLPHFPSFPSCFSPFRLYFSHFRSYFSGFGSKSGQIRLYYSISLISFLF